MSSGAVSNLGTKLKLGNGGSPEVFTEVPEVRLIPPIEEEQEDIEVTHHGSVGYREYISSGLADGGEFSFDMQSLFPNDVQDDIRALRISGVVANWQVVYPNGLGTQFAGYVKTIVKNEADAQSPEALLETVTIKVSGNITDISASV